MLQHVAVWRSVLQCFNVMVGVVEQVEEQHASLVGVVRGLLHVDKHSRLSAVALRTLLLSIHSQEFQRVKLVCMYGYIYSYL